MTITAHSFKDFNELSVFMRKNNKVADDRTSGWQMRAKPGDHYMSNRQDIGLVVYAEVLDPASPPSSEPMSDEERAEYEYEKHLWSQDHMKNIRFIRGHSAACPEGEMGDAHVSTITAFMSKAEFERAKERGWPTEAKEVAKILDAFNVGNTII